MRQYIARPSLLNAVSSALEEAPVVALLGARQVGKTTLARQVADAWPEHSRLLDLEVPAVREALTETPETVLRSSEGLVVVDEVQRQPTLFEVLRRGKRWGFEFKCTDAPRTTKAMHIAIDDLGLEHLWVVYPGNLRFSLTDRITALPLAEVSDIVFQALP